jgi:membrane protease YdiL (CAAX protease family)
MTIKILFIIVFLFILFSLGSALFHLVRKKDAQETKKTVTALSYRIGISLVLFIALFIAYKTGMVRPEGIGARMLLEKTHQQQQKINQE